MTMRSGRLSAPPRRVAALLAAAVIAVAALLTSSPARAQERFTLGLERLDLSDLDPRTQARLAQWNDPMGRVEAHVRQQQADILRGGQPGGSGAIAFRAKLQRGFKPRLMVAWVDAGTDVYERSMGVIRWPWSDRADEVPSVEEQLALLLGRRLERSSIGGAEPGASP